MSIVPEYILQQTLVRGLRAVREDGRIIDALFRNLRQDDLQSLRVFFREQTIDIAINYPDADLKLPAIVILLKAENESTAFLGNMMQAPSLVQRTGLPFNKDELAGDRTQVGAGTTSHVHDPNLRVLMTAVTAASGGTSSVSVPASALPLLFDPFEETAILRILEGTGAGQSDRQVVSVTPSAVGGDTVIEVTPAWDTQPDNTSVVRIHTDQENEGYTGEPARIFSSTDVVERVGAHYNVQYQLLILAPNPELTVFLYNVVKAIMFINTDFLVKQGFLNLQISGSDFLPRSEFLPDLAYQRAMTLNFDYSFDLYQLASENVLLDKLRVSLTVHNPDVSNVSQVERIALETEIDLP
jgi:hypothetical protein